MLRIIITRVEKSFLDLAYRELRVTDNKKTVVACKIQALAIRSKVIGNKKYLYLNEI